MKKLVIFDFDGTLADTIRCIVRATQDTLSECGCPFRSKEEIKAVIGLPLEKCFEILIEANTYLLIDSCCQAYQKHFAAHLTGNVSLFPHVKEVLLRLNKYGIILAIATSRSSQTLNEICDMLNIDDLIDYKLAADQVFNKKPAPEMVEKILAHLEISPDEALVVGDTIYDIEMGQRAGCDTCGVTWGNQTRPQLEAQHPTFLIDDINELIPCMTCSTRII